jgi:hypothetical protein
VLESRRLGPLPGPLSPVHLRAVAALADTSLSADERTLLDRFASELRARLGDDLRAMWLFGSRIRAERSPGADSDVDVLVVADDATWTTSDVFMPPWTSPPVPWISRTPRVAAGLGALAAAEANP